MKKLVLVLILMGFFSNIWGASLEKVDFQGVLEVESQYIKNYQQVISSNTYVKKIEPTFVVSFGRNVTGEIIFLHDPNNSFIVDQAHLTYRPSAKSWFFVSAGKKIVPFGHFTTYLVTDPLSLSFAESRENVFELGVEKSGFMASAFVFKGSKKRAGQDDKIRDGGASLNYENSVSKLDYKIGTYYLTSLAETDALQKKVGGSLSSNYKSKIPGYGYFFDLTYSHFHFSFEHILAKKAFHVSDLSFDNRGARPSVMNVELAYDFKMLKKEFIIAVAYQKTKELIAAGLPKDKKLFGFGGKISKNSDLMLELSQQTDYGKTHQSGSIRGTGNSTSAYKLNWRAYF